MSGSCAFACYCKQAELSGEDMLRFRNGDDLYPYCTNCAYSAMTPIMGVLGCTKGDEPKVKEFSARYELGEIDDEVEKCPLYSIESGDAGRDTNYTLASRMSEAGLLKDVPAEISMVSEGLEDKHPEWNYDYLLGDEDPGVEKIVLYSSVKYASSTDTSDLPEREKFFKLLDKMGVGRVQDDGAKKQLITTALMEWKDGLLAPHVDADFVDAVLRDFISGRWSE